MSDKWQALDTFWNRFNIPAYDENTVPQNAVFPYITYEASIGDFDNNVALTASVWYRSTSWQDVSQKVNQISEYIGSGASAKYTNGRIWITKENPFAQRMNDPSDDMIRRIVLQVKAEYQ